MIRTNRLKQLRYASIPLTLLSGGVYFTWNKENKKLIEDAAPNISYCDDSLTNNDIKVTQSWKETLAKSVPSIVAIRCNRPKGFDMEPPSNSWATGFVIDHVNGIILSNRHVVGTGPNTAEAIFMKGEEVDIIPIYRDPVHDFGFFKYNPQDVHYTKVESLPLLPKAATIGTDIRVVGNDAAEKLAIASGTLARLDRQAPFYGKDRYNDFNTFYFQASSGTSGGSSGSPVLNNKGEVVALNAAGKMGTAASYYLPLDRVKRAYELLRDGKEVTRGTIQTTFQHKPFDEIRRLGVTVQTEELIRQIFPDETGMLVVHVIPDLNTKNKKLQVGDVLIKANDKIITKFVPLEEILDDSIGRNIKVEIQRAGQTMILDIEVEDLHSITPSMFIEMGGAIFNPLSYQQARHRGLTPGLPYVARRGYALKRARIPSGSIITSIDGQSVKDLASLEKILLQCRDGQRVLVKYNVLTGNKSSKVEIVHIDRKWFPFQSCVRNDQKGSWICKDHFDAKKQEEHSTSLIGETSILQGKNAIESKLSPSFVIVHCDRPFSVNSNTASNYCGTGLIVDKDAGLVVVDRDTVPDIFCDISLSISNTLHVPATVAFIHPVHNFAIVQYNPEHIGSTNVSSCKIAGTPAKPSDNVWLVGLAARNSELVSRETIVTGVNWVKLSPPSPPRYQQHNLELISLQDTVSNQGGAICNQEGEIQALWASFYYQAGSKRHNASFMQGIPIDIILESVESLKSGRIPTLFNLGVDFELISLAKGRELGIDQSLATALEDHAPERRTVLSIIRRWGGTKAREVLKDGDIVVEIDGNLVSTFRQVEQATQKSTEVVVKVIREGKQMDIKVNTFPLNSCEVDRVIFWQGLLLQVPALPVAAQHGISNRDGVFIGCQYFGSPGARYGLPPSSILREIDGEQIVTLDDFIRIVKTKEKNESVRIKYTDLSGTVHLKTLKLEHSFWPTTQLRYQDGKWTRTEV